MCIRDRNTETMNNRSYLAYIFWKGPDFDSDDDGNTYLAARNSYYGNTLNIYVADEHLAGTIQQGGLSNSYKLPFTFTPFYD